MGMDAEALIVKYESVGQGQVFRFFEELDHEGKEALLEQAGSIDLGEIGNLYSSWKGHACRTVDFGGLEPAPYVPHWRSPYGDPGSWARAKETGMQALADGKVAAFTVAGGQGTRLGFDAPKGTFPVTPVLNKSLFQVFAEKIKAVGNDCGQPIEWLVMTSQDNDADTRSFFLQNSFFGLEEGQVYFFTQGLMPVVDKDGKILLSGKGKIAMSPDGHGGSLRALARSGHLSRLKEKGVEMISYFQVDNPLAQCIDPEFVGFHIMEGAEISSKMILKAYPLEKVGHFCIQDGKQVVIEYSDLPAEMQEETLEDGSLRFRAGSIAIHIIGLDFANRLGEGKDTALALPFHFANKKVPFLDDVGNLVEPEEPNGVKFEMFIFDALPLAKRAVIVETRREDEFSPVKNAEGKDSPATCKADQSKQHMRWLALAGETTAGMETVEISPLFAHNQEIFIERWAALGTKPTLVNNLYIQ